MIKKYREGLTLVEIVISIALLGILGLALVFVFTNYTVSIFESGHMTSEILSARSVLDMTLSGEDLTKHGFIATADGFENSDIDTTVVMEKNTSTTVLGSSSNKVIPGTTVTVHSGTNNPVTLTGFIPDETVGD